MLLGRARARGALERPRLRDRVAAGRADHDGPGPDVSGFRAVSQGERTVGEVRGALDRARAGREMYTLVEELYPLCRSITGDGVRETLRRVAAHADLNVHEVPTGTTVFDWTVPKEWNIRDAYVKNARGERIIDLKASSLHVVSYSTPVHATMPLSELKPHLHALPDKPDWIP